MSTKSVLLRYLPDSLVRIGRAVHYRRSLRHYDVASEPDLAGCRRIIRAGDVVVDVGANIGVYTKFFSDFVGPSGRVYSLEPVPETFSYLSGNVRSLKLSNVTCLNVAASDHDGESDRMSVPQYSTGGKNLYEAKLAQDGNVPVRSARLDTLFPELRPSVIKCDVEGHDIACVSGGLELLRRCGPVWVVEVSSQATLELFASLQYAAYAFDNDRFRPYANGAPAANCFFFPNGHQPPQS